MSTPVTSPEAQLPQTGGMKAQWAEFFAYLRRPNLPEKAAGIDSGSLIVTFRMLALDYLLVGALLAALFAAMGLGLEIPETALAGMEITPALIALVVLGAPLGEELVFRSWLSGRPGHVLGVVTAVIVGLIAATIAPVILDLSTAADKIEFAGMAISFGAAVGVIAALPVVYLLRNRGPMRWFAAIFPAILFLSALAFASVHLANYEEEISPLLWLLVLPQFVLGLICAYVRVKFGLWSAILVHALHNGTIMAIVVAAESAGVGV